MSTLKERKEDFVTGLNGGSIQEINIITSVALTSYLCWNLLNEVYNDRELNPIIDFTLNWLALLFSITLYSDDTRLLTILLLSPCLLVFLYAKVFRREGRPKSTEIVVDEEDKKFFEKEKAVLHLVKKPYITAYRSGMLILTCIAILAVDFPIFPRRFAKVETWGTSLMDLGVGSFVFSNGLVSARSMLKPGPKPSFSRRLKSALRSSGALLALGLLRLFFVKKLDYQEHVTEYGIHWNFFITLSLLPIFLVFVDPITTHIPLFLVALLISMLYEFIMIKDDKFLTFMILSERDNFFKANREGIFSFIGYCAIFLWGQSTGFYVLGDVPTKNNLYKASLQVVDPKQWKKLGTWDRWTTVKPLTGLIIWTVITSILACLVLALHPLNVSRRFANFPYTLWVVAYNLGFLAIYCGIDWLFERSSRRYKVPVSLEAINSNGLFVFLLANVGTGLTNMSLATIDASDGVAILTLVTYCGALALIALVLYRRRIFIKL